MGYCGLVSVGHAGFLAIGAYVAAFVVNHLSGNAVLAIFAGAVAAGLVGGLCTVHEFGYSYSDADQAVLGAFADLVSLALS